MSVLRIVPLIAAAALAWPALVDAQQTVYRWVDQDGKIHFSDTPPPKEATGISQKRVGGGYVEESQLPYATQMAVKRNPVTLYTGSGCGPACDQARGLLVKRGVPHSERDATADKAASDDLEKLVGGIYVPVLTVGEAKLKGFEEGAWTSALDSAGYPRTALPGQLAPRAPTPAPQKATEAEASREPSGTSVPK